LARSAGQERGQARLGRNVEKLGAPRRRAIAH
jgi:hypothetical protein